MSEPTVDIPAIDPSNPPAPTTPPRNLLDDLQDEAASIFGEKKPEPAQPKAAEPAPKPEPKEPEAAKPAIPEFKAPEAPADPDVPTNLSPKAADSFKKIKAERDAVRKELEAIRKSAEAPKEPVLPPDYEQLKKEREELSAIVQQTSVENHPQFKAYFNTRIEQAVATAKSLVPPDKADHVAQLLSQPDSPYKRTQLNEVLSEMMPVEQAQFGAALLDLNKVQAERQGELAKARTNFEAIQRQEQARVDAQRQALVAQFDEAAQAARSLPVFADKGGDERIAAARQVFSGQLPPADLARASLWAVAAPAILQDSMNKDKKIETLEAELARLRSSDPSIGGAASSDPEPEDKNVSYTDAIFKRANKELGPRW